MEAKYIALRHGARKAIWIKRFVNELKLEVTETTTLYDYNKISTAFTKNVKKK